MMLDPQAPKPRFTLLSDPEVRQLSSNEWRINNVLPKVGTVAIFGEVSIGKSFAVIDMIHAIDRGIDWFGHETIPCKVLYCALENQNGTGKRVDAYHKHHGTTSSDINYLVEPLNLLKDSDVTELAQLIMASGQHAEVVVIDTLNRAMPGADENESKAMGSIIAAITRLQNIIGGLVVLIHHPGKDTKRGLRGHSSLHAALDAVIEIKRFNGNLGWTMTKNRDGENSLVHPFKLEVVQLETVDDELFTSCVIMPMMGATHVKKVLPPKSFNQRIVWDAIREVFLKAGASRPADAPANLPEGKPCITFEAALDVARSKLPCDQKRLTERATAAINALVNNKLLCHESGFLWCM